MRFGNLSLSSPNISLSGGISPTGAAVSVLYFDWGMGIPNILAVAIVLLLFEGDKEREESKLWPFVQLKIKL